jgi:hypothetical protein
LAQQRIPGGVSAGVVDDLELVEIKVQQSVPQTVVCRVESLLRARLELMTIREAGEGVMECESLDGRLCIPVGVAVLGLMM